MTRRTGGGAATNSGIDFQQRVAAFFVLAMGLDLDCSSILERDDKTKICKVAFETEDAVDDIVITHESSKTYLQVKRKLSFSEKVDSEFYKTIDQFVRQYYASQNKNDCYAIVTSSDSSRTILSELKKITTSERLNNEASTDNPLSISEKSTYQSFLNCIKTSLKQNKLLNDTKVIQHLISRIYVIDIAIENNGIYEKSFLASISSRLCTTPKLLWGHIISKTLDWSKNRQSIDIDGINSILNNFISNGLFDNEIDKYDETLFSVEFDPDKYNICSGREVVIVDSFLPEFDIALLELYRFDDNGEFRIKFYDHELEMSDGSRHNLYGRFSTLSGAVRFITENEWIHEKKMVISELNDDINFDSSTIAIVYSEKVRQKVLNNREISKCIHCQGGLSSSSMLIEVSEVGLPFDTGMIHKRCLRVSDRVLGTSSNPGFDEHPELQDFDYQKWFLSLDKGQAVWIGSSKFSQQVKNVLWNSNSGSTKDGQLCIKAILSNGDYQYVQERGRVGRYNAERAKFECKQLNNWIEDSKDKGNPICYSLDGQTQGMYNDIQNSSSQPVELIECVKFEVTQYTRGISKLNDKIKNFYAPLISLVNKESSNPLLVDNTAFLISSPMELKLYLKNWVTIGFSYSLYKLDIIDSDECFDKFMRWANEKEINVLIDPFFDESGQLSKGVVMQDMESIEKGQDLKSF
ncbi:hypothetical protein Q6344_03380 [Psychrobacter cibarius]|nr:hypothetical protein Q6344_03380 [Psychrobacter cibarius]